jgi:hypothetical protein
VVGEIKISVSVSVSVSVSQQKSLMAMTQVFIEVNMPAAYSQSGRTAPVNISKFSTIFNYLVCLTEL